MLSEKEKRLLSIREKGVPPSLQTPAWGDKDPSQVAEQMITEYKKNPIKAYQSSSFVEWASKSENIKKYLDVHKFRNNISGKDVLVPKLNGKPFIAYDCMLLTDRECLNGSELCTRFNSTANEGLATICNAYIHYLGKEPNGAPTPRLNTLITEICNKHPNLDECKCVNRYTQESWQKWGNDLLTHGSYTPIGSSESLKKIPPAKCWYPNCQYAWIWVDSSAYPPDKCGDIYYCKQKINISNDTKIINSVINMFESGCQCQYDNDCNTASGKKCVNNKCVECDITADCPVGKVCVDRQWCRECIDNKQCRTDQVCNSLGNCVECELKSDCPGNLQCENYKCVECSDTILCPDNKKCINNRCYDCLIDSDCSSQQECVNNMCTDKRKTTDTNYIFYLIIGIVIILIIFLIIFILLTNEDDDDQYDYEDYDYN